MDMYGQHNATLPHHITPDVEFGVGGGGNGGGGLYDDHHNHPLLGSNGTASHAYARKIDLKTPLMVVSGVGLLFLLFSSEFRPIFLVLTICGYGTLFSLYLSHWVLSKDDGTPEMREVSNPIREGAEGFLRIQYTAISRIAVGIAGLIFFSYALRPTSTLASGVEKLGNITLGVLCAISFLIGAVCSAGAGYISMWVSAQANIRVTSAARRSYGEALLICFRGGAFSAVLDITLCVAGVSILYVSLYTMFSSTLEATDIPLLMVGYGFGASFVALFMQLGGGIYTKAADVGADLVGKVEAGIPEDDPRNPAVIADLVGDMVGDCVGSSADVFESVAAEIIGAMILGGTLARESQLEYPVAFVFFPVVVHAFDIIVSSIGIMMVTAPSEVESARGNHNPMGTLQTGYNVSLGLALVAFCFTTRWLLYSDAHPNAWFHFFLCGVVGMVTAYVFVKSTQYYTDYAYYPVRSIAKASTTGHGTNIITGVAVGMKSTVVPTLMVSVAVISAYHLGASSGIGGPNNRHAGLFGTAVATMGMLSSAVFVLAMNNYGPIADNAGGIAEMSSQPEYVRDATDKLDAAGNVTKAITKGYSIGSAALACFVLFGAFMDEFSEFAGKEFKTVDIATVEVLVGGLLGTMMVFFFTGLAVAAVGDTAGEVVNEVRRQFEMYPGIMEGKQKPDYRTCVALVTEAALKQMRLPGLLAVLLPVAVGLVFRVIGEYQGKPLLGAEVLAGYLMFGTVTGIMMALFLDNVGGAWDNAKKYVELGNFGGKGSEAHKAAVTGDTVGDPFKDTAGPALHVVIKLLSTTVLVFGPLFVSRVAETLASIAKAQFEAEERTREIIVVIMSGKKPKKQQQPPASPSAASASGRQEREREDEMRVSDISDESSVVSSPRRGGHERPRFDSKASWADSTRFDMGRADSRASDISARDLRLTTLSKSHVSSRNRSHSNASRLSRASSRASNAGGGGGAGGNRGRQSSFVSNFGVTKGRKDSNALSTITENWNLADDQFGSPFADFDAQDQPIRDQLQRGLNIINDHTTKLKEIEDAITAAMSEVWGYWADPIQLFLHPAERVDVQDLIKTDNELFNKVLTVFSVLCDEISELKVTVEDNFYPALIMFGQACHGEEGEVKAGEDEVHIGRMLPFFQDISNFVDRCNAITINMIHQLASLYQSFQKLWKSTFKLVHLHPVFDALASLLEVMITIDAIVIDNPNIITSWDKYKRMMQYVRADPTRYNTTVEKVKQFERLLVSLDQTIMSAQVFQTCIEQDFEAFSSLDPGDEDDEDRSDDGESGRASSDRESKIDIRANRVFLDEFLHCISARLGVAEAAINSATETYERSNLVGTAGLYVLHRRLLPANVPADPALYKRLWETQMKAPCVTICGKILWYVPDFLLKYAPMNSKKLQPADIVQFRREYLHSLDEAFPGDVASAKMELNAWLVRMESFFQPTTRGMGDASRTLSVRGNLILKGLILAKRVQTMMHTLVNLHLALGIPMQKRVVRPLYTCIEVLKAVEFMFARKNPILAECTSLLIRQVTHSLFAFFRPLKAKLEASKRFDDTKLDVLAAVTVLEDILHSGESFSYTRITVLDLATQIALISPDSGASVVDGDGSIGIKNADEPIKLIWKLRLLSDFQRKIRNACDCSFFYWSRELLHPFLQDLYGQPEQANRIQYVIGGFLDAIKLLRGAQHETENALYVNAYSTFIDSVIEEEIVENLCKDVENDLRLHIHSVHLDHLDAPNPKSADFKVLHYYLDLRPIRLHGKTLDLRLQVTHYLESTFYNLTTVALHDWKTYGEMRNLANDKYGLSLADNHLPMGSLDQGLDILQIMRNIQIFVARYNYNLNQQFFLERRSDKGSRHLNSINIHSIASSIRTHGMGIMNTTVNFTYQFLTKKFDIFSQFLFDEYIKSYLQREKRWYKKHRDDPNVDNKYPYERAFQFNKDIRKLGVSDSGKTFLDQFRMLITEIGNALGYVRMVRSAGMNYCSNAIKFVPDLNHTHFKFEAYAGEGLPRETDEETGDVTQQEINGAKLSRETVIAAKNLDSVISTLAKNFSENNDYFKVLVKVFQDVTASDEQKHLVNFYHIIPALTINFVETTVQAKDLMYKNTRRRESYFSDDGFAIGLAYILAILNQGEAFDALHWFEEVVRKYKDEEDAYNLKQAEREERKREQALRQQKETTAELIDDEEEVHTLQLTAKRIELNRREFDLLDWSLNGARIFFKD